MRAEQELLKAFVEGDILAMEQIVDTYKDDVYNLCFRLTYSRHDADELFQDTWLNVIKGAPSFSDKSFKNWVYTICINRHRDRCRREKRRKRIIADNFRDSTTKDHAMSLLVSDDDTEKTVEEKFVSSMLMSKIEQLDEKYRIPVKLFYFENLKYSDIAEICSIP
ncbi:MAG: sigma-70 family RNA polymerase sigma factor, partial [Clostridia bacterium]|nr:sigma-70 family RNA polymerase sigma factor [Clostridia bacterium]